LSPSVLPLFISSYESFVLVELGSLSWGQECQGLSLKLFRLLDLPLGFRLCLLIIANSKKL
jgi:hypothetical protein